MRRVLLAIAAGLVLADASIVTLALPDLLHDLHTDVVGVAAVLGVYTAVLAVALVPFERWARRTGPATAGVIGLVVVALTSVVCAAAQSLEVLLIARAVQALGGALGLAAIFDLAEGGGAGRRHWVAAGVLGTALGPALGGALTEAFDWRAIFIAQAPIALAGAAACVWRVRGAAARDDSLSSLPPPGSDLAGLAPPAAAPAIGPTGTAVRRRPDAPGGFAPPSSAPAVGPTGTAVRRRPSGMHPSPSPTRFTPRPAVALALVSAALSAVLFLLVLLLVAGWAVSPLAAAGAVSTIPIGALLGARVQGDAQARAAAGSALLGAGVLALTWLPRPNLLWTVIPGALAGVGMGLALPALGGELLPERSARDAVRILTLRHVGIALILAALGPLIANRLETSTETARLRGVALILDAKLPPLKKISLAPALLKGVDARTPRAGLRDALKDHRKDFDGSDRDAYDTLAQRADDTVIEGVGGAFRASFAITGVLALLAALMLLPVRVRQRIFIPAVASIVLAVPAAYALAQDRLAPEPVKLLKPCQDHKDPGSGGITGFLQDRAIDLLDVTACRLKAPREVLVLAVFDDKEAKAFKRKYGVDPRSVSSVLTALIGG